MRDTIFINDLSCQAIIGVLPEERTAPQPLNISLEIETDSTLAAFNADLEQTIDYAYVALEVEELAINAEAHLLETLAENIAKCILVNPKAIAVTVSLDKPNAIPGAQTVGVRIYRER
jgi:dihydroneopterin aldolase